MPRRAASDSARPVDKLRSLLKSSATCRLRGRGVRKHFCGRDGARLKGVTKQLERHVFSKGTFSHTALCGAQRGRKAHWRGSDGGRRRGSAVDAQVAKLANLSSSKREGRRMLHLTRLIFSFLETRGWDAIMGQRGVCIEARRLGTAVDLVCYSATERALVLVELKCGYAGDRTAPARRGGRAAHMQHPFDGVPDTLLNRHLAQLTATQYLLQHERRWTSTRSSLSSLSVDSVQAVLLYANDAHIEEYALPQWWLRRAAEMVSRLSA